MAIFAVLADKSNAKLGEVISQQYPNDSIPLSTSQWLISADTLANPLAEKLGVRTSDFGRVLVIETTGFGAGFHSKTVWEWIQQKRGKA